VVDASAGVEMLLGTPTGQALQVLARHLQAPLVTADLNLANAPGIDVPTIHP
jgi:hypothetical protein